MNFVFRHRSISLNLIIARERLRFASGCLLILFRTIRLIHGDWKPTSKKQTKRITNILPPFFSSTKRFTLNKVNILHPTVIPAFYSKQVTTFKWLKQTFAFHTESQWLALHILWVNCVFVGTLNLENERERGRWIHPFIDLLFTQHLLRLYWRTECSFLAIINYCCLFCSCCCWSWCWRWEGGGNFVSVMNRLIYSPSM